MYEERKLERKKQWEKERKRYREKENYMKSVNNVLGRNKAGKKKNERNKESSMKI